MAQEGRAALPGGDAAAVVRDPDERHAAPLDLNGHCRRPGVDGVLHQLLHHRGRPLHHLPGGDQVGHMGVQHLDRGVFGFGLFVPWHGVFPYLVKL